jgi:hypothetical protein
MMIEISEASRECVASLEDVVLKDVFTSQRQNQESECSTLLLVFEDGRSALIEPMERDVTIGSLPSELFVPEVLCGREVRILYGPDRTMPVWIPLPAATHLGALRSASVVQRENSYTGSGSGEEVASILYQHGLVLGFAGGYMTITLADSIPATMYVRIGEYAALVDEDTEMRFLGGNY